jgi:predicted dehydrogenase
MTRLDVGIIGCGLIAQVEHLPNLLSLPERFRVAGIADPSAKVRGRLAQRYGVTPFASAAELLAQHLDAVLIATPDAYHAELVLAALERGLHVFVEKPLCYDPADAARIAGARDRAGRIVQVGYMKRFDPATRLLRELLAKQTTPIRAINVEVVDPDFWPFTGHRDLTTGDDVPAALVSEGGARRLAQIAGALGFTPDQAALRSFAGPFCSSLVHDVNLVQGLLDPLQQGIGEPISAAFFAGDGGGMLSARLKPADAVVSMSWVAAPGLAHYSERLSLIFDDAEFELRFRSPYLNHQPTVLVERRSEGLVLEETVHRRSYEEAFVEELKGWHDAIHGTAPVVNTVEEAGRDMALLSAFGRLALRH